MDNERRRGRSVLPLLLGVALLTGCASVGGAGSPFPELQEYAGREVESVEFINAAPFSEDTLEAIVQTDATRCRLLGLPFCLPFTDIGRREHYLNLSEVASDVVRLAVFYRQAGFFGTRVRPGVQPRGDAVAVTFAIQRGDSIVLEQLEVQGVEEVLDTAALRRVLPSKEGALFDVGRFFASADTVLSRLRANGYAYAEVLRNYGVDTIQDRGTASILAIPGPRVVIDSIIVTGAESLGREATLRQLEFADGDVLRAADLVQSQRNLYLVDLIQFANVEVAPDSLQLARDDSTSATVIVRVSEGPVHVVDATIGYATVECLRSSSSWTSRSLFGAGRRLSIGGEVSKIGVGDPTAWGLEKSICDAFEGDLGPEAPGFRDFSDALDYRLSVDFLQPYLFGPRNQLTTTLFSERIAEPGLYRRNATGGRFGVIRRIRGVQDLVSGQINIERGRTEASAAIFCLALGVCQEEAFEHLSRSHWRNFLLLTGATDRSDSPLDPKRGYSARTTVAWATPFLGTDGEFDTHYVRWTGDASYYRPIGGNRVAAVNLRLGSFFGSASVTDDEAGGFVSPEDRFYAGGANSVRGFGLNELGPGVYVSTRAKTDSLGNVIRDPDAPIAFVPTGGTSLAVASAELRFPSPFLGDYLRLAAFVDAGNVGEGGFFDFDTKLWRVTPGAGLRIQTPVGPARLDVSYNAHDLPVAPLLVSDPQTGALVRVQDRFPGVSRDFLSRLQIHIAVGQAF